MQLLTGFRLVNREVSESAIKNAQTLTRMHFDAEPFLDVVGRVQVTTTADLCPSKCKCRCARCRDKGEVPRIEQELVLVELLAGEVEGEGRWEPATLSVAGPSVPRCVDVHCWPCQPVISSLVSTECSAETQRTEGPQTQVKR